MVSTACFINHFFLSGLGARRQPRPNVQMGDAKRPDGERVNRTGHAIPGK